MKYSGAFASSEDPEKLSKTVQGVIIGASSLIVFFGIKVLGVEISTNDVALLATNLGAVAGAVVSVYGLIMKWVNKTQRG